MSADDRRCRRLTADWASDGQATGRAGSHDARTSARHTIGHWHLQSHDGHRLIWWV